MTADPPSPARSDAWQLAGLPGGLRQASYLTTPEETAGQYRAIVDTLLEQQQRSLTGVGLDELTELLTARLREAAGAEAVERLMPGLDLSIRMEQLGRWGVVTSWDDRSLRPDNFLANATRYQLTAIAAQLHRAVTSLGIDDADSLAATFAPAVLVAQLAVMERSLAEDPAAANEAWSVLRTTLAQMSRAAQNWQATLAEALAGAPDAAKVGSLQQTLQLYVTMWGAGVDAHSHDITATAEGLHTQRVDLWRAAALAALGAETPEDRVQSLMAEYRQTLDTLLSWFAGPAAQARRLRRQMRDAIAPMVRGQRTLAAVGGHVSRRAELLDLAGRLERCADDRSAWQLWCAATGLFSAQHLALVGPDTAGSPGATSFWDAPPVPVSVRLRSQGKDAAKGSVARIPDRRAGREQARAQAAAARLREAEVVAALRDRSGRPLSQWSGLNAAQLDILLSLLTAIAAARQARPGEGNQLHTVDAETGDGRWRVRAATLPPGTPAAVIHTAPGRLVCPDVVLTVLRSPGVPAELNLLA